MKFTAERLDILFEGIQNAKIAVIGDLMLDRYVWGVAERISPEAPVPVVTLTGESSNLGGAANVASNVASLGAECRLIGIVGADEDGRILRDIVRRSGLGDDGIVTDPARPTSVKTRVIAQNQHVVRIDRETSASVVEEVADKLLDKFRQSAPSLSAVIMEDYNKGVLAPSLIEAVISECRAAGILVGVDPKKENFWRYQGATLFKPNLKEFETAVGRPLRTDKALTEAAQEAIVRMGFEYMLITRGELGMALFNKEEVTFIATKAHRVHDVSGAGDTVIATIMAALAGGADIHEAALLANYAASIVIAEIGAVPVDRNELRRVCLGR